MILFTILVFVALVIAAILGLLGVGIFVIFGDIIMCAGIIYGLSLIYKWFKQEVKHD